MSRAYRFLIAGLLVGLCACASVEKHHHFKIDRSESASKSLAVCEHPGKWSDPIRIGTHEFYVETESSPYWLGFLFIPIYPVETSLKAIRLNFGSELPTNAQDWALRFESDGLIVKGQVGPELYGKTYQIVFNFPGRSRTGAIELWVPEAGGTKKIKILEETKWAYHPIWLPYGDTFPRMQSCH